MARFPSLRRCNPLHPQLMAAFAAAGRWPTSPGPA